MFRKTFLALGASALVACGGGGGGDDIAGPGASLAGTYNLQSINGANVPATLIQVPGYTLRVTSGALTLNANNTYSNSTTIQETESGQTTNTTAVCTGTYSRNGNSVTFTQAASADCDAGTFTASWNGSNTMTVAYDAQLQAVYTR